MPNMPKIPTFALALLIIMGLLAAAMSCRLAIVEGTGPAQEIKRRPMPALIAYLTNPDAALPNPATVNVPATVKFRMEPASDVWKLQRWAGGAWGCAGGSFDTNYSESADSDLGRIATAVQIGSTALYLRGVVPAEGADPCYSLAELASVTRVMQVTFGTAAPADPPPGYGAAPDGIDSIDTLIYQTPGDTWTAQILVSIGAAGVIMVILRSMAGLLIGAAAMPVSAYLMASIGYGSYWYVAVTALLLAFAVAAVSVLIRKN